MATTITARELKVEIDRSQPWGEWPRPSFAPVPLHSLEFFARDGAMIAHNPDLGEMPVTAQALADLGGKVTFPTEFVQKLPLGLQASVINDRVRSHNDGEVGLVLHDGRLTDLLPSAREMLAYSETAQVAYDTITQALGEVNVEGAFATESGLVMKLLTDIQQPVTRKVGDVLQAGICVRQDYGDTTEVELYLRRLVCLNGMTRTAGEFRWNRKAEGTRRHQAVWLQEGIVGALGAYENVLNQARRMSETAVEGDPEEALLERARSLGIPRRHHDDLLHAYRAEPEPTEWGMLNAVTRLATHTALPGDLGQRLQAGAGAWADGFDLVTARMPRPVAVRVGARIIEQIGDEE